MSRSQREMLLIELEFRQFARIFVISEMISLSVCRHCRAIPRTRYSQDETSVFALRGASTRRFLSIRLPERGRGRKEGSEGGKKVLACANREASFRAARCAPRLHLPEIHHLRVPPPSFTSSCFLPPPFPSITCFSLSLSLAAPLTALDCRQASPGRRLLKPLSRS